MQDSSYLISWFRYIYGLFQFPVFVEAIKELYMYDIINFYLTKANYWPLRRSTKVHGLHTLVLLRFFISNTRFFQLEYDLQRLQMLKKNRLVIRGNFMLLNVTISELRLRQFHKCCLLLKRQFCHTNTFIHVKYFNSTNRIVRYVKF